MSCVAAGLQVLLGDELVDFQAGALLVAEDLALAQRSARIRDSEVKAVRSAVVLRSPPAPGLSVTKMNNSN